MGGAHPELDRSEPTLDGDGGAHLIDYNENIRLLVDELTHRVKEIELA